MAHTITLNRPDDERLEILIDGTEITTVSHDSVGWAGMEAVENVARGLAKKLGIQLDETYGEDEA